MHYAVTIYSDSGDFKLLGNGVFWRYQLAE